MLKWLSHAERQTVNNFKQGKFKFDLTEDKFHKLLSVRRFIDFLRDRNVKPALIFTQKAFHIACYEFFNNPVIDIERFFDRLENCTYTISLSRFINEYIQQFADIYNFKMKENRIKVIRDGDKTQLVDKI